MAFAVLQNPLILIVEQWNEELTSAAAVSGASGEALAEIRTNRERRTPPPAGSMTGPPIADERGQILDLVGVEEPETFVDAGGIRRTFSSCSNSR